MTIKYQRPSSAYTGATNLANRNKYQVDASAQPKVSISSQKMDGDFNYIIDHLNMIDAASGSASSIAERLNQSLNSDGSIKASASFVLDDWIHHEVTGLNRVDGSTLTFNGDGTNLYMTNRRVRLIVSGLPLFAHVESAVVNSGVTILTLVDIIDGAGAIQRISIAPSEISYSPIITGYAGNESYRFENLLSGAFKLQAEEGLFILEDTSALGETYALRSKNGVLEILQNTGTEISPVWNMRASIDAAGISLSDNSVTTSKISNASVTAEKLENTGVTSGTYSVATVTVDDKGRITSASNGSSPTPSDASVTVKGIVELATNAEVVTGTDTGRVAPVSALKEHQGMCKAWVKFNGQGGVSIRDSYNVSSITDLGIGNYNVNFSNAMGNTNYAIAGSALYHGAGTPAALVCRAVGDSISTNFVEIRTGNSSNGGSVDFAEVHLLVFGD